MAGAGEGRDAAAAEGPPEKLDVKWTQGSRGDKEKPEAGLPHLVLAHRKVPRRKLELERRKEGRRNEGGMWGESGREVQRGKHWGCQEAGLLLIRMAHKKLCLNPEGLWRSQQTERQIKLLESKCLPEGRCREENHGEE